MIPKDCVEQLIGETESWDQYDTFAFSFGGGTVNGKKHDHVSVDFAAGTVVIYDSTGTSVLERFAIKCTLEPITSEEPNASESNT